MAASSLTAYHNDALISTARFARRARPARISVTILLDDFRRCSLGNNCDSGSREVSRVRRSSEASGLSRICDEEAHRLEPEGIGQPVYRSPAAPRGVEPSQDLLVVQAGSCPRRPGLTVVSPALGAGQVCCQLRRLNVPQYCSDRVMLGAQRSDALAENRWSRLFPSVVSPAGGTD